MSTPPPASRTYATLRSLLHASPASSPSPALPGGWAETMPARPASRSKRGAIPVWDDPPVVEQRVGDKERERAERERKERELSEIAERVVYQAGTDSATPPGPLIVVAPVHLPPPALHSHVILFEKLRLRLEAFSSQGGYSVVLLPSPTPHPPTTALLVSSYLALPRSTRKNVRRVWVVGGGWWVRVILTIFSTTLLSGKTAKRKKVVLCPSLSRLAVEMGPEAFVRIEFPPEVYVENAAVESAISMPVSSNSPSRMFGVPLEILMGEDGELGLPRVVKDCLAVLMIEGPSSVGIFRRSPSSAMVKQLQDAYDRGHPMTLSLYPDAPYLAASLLKLFLRSLPSAVFPSSMFPLVRACPSKLSTPFPTPTTITSATYIRHRILPALPAHSLLVLEPLVSLLRAIASESQTNLMDVNNLCICLCPGLVGGLGDMMDELEMCRVPGTARGVVPGARNSSGGNTVGGVLQVLIESYDEIFGDDDLKVLVPLVRAPISFDSISEDPPSGVIPITSPSTLSPSTSFSSIASTSPTRSRRSPALGTLSRSHSKTGLLDSPRLGPRTLRAKASRNEVTAGEGIMGLFANGSAGDEA